jgi:hypothetical protein
LKPSGCIVADRGETIRCTRCGAEVQIKLPAPISEWVRAVNRFERDHRNCQERADWSHLQTYYTHWSPLPSVREPGKEA